MSLTHLTNIIPISSHGKHGRDIVIQLRELASNSIGSLNRSLSFKLQHTISLIQSIQTEIGALDKQIKLVLHKLDTPLITISGIGYSIAAIILPEIGDINNLSSPAKLFDFAGIKHSTYQSGKSNVSEISMFKRGSTYLRWAIMKTATLLCMMQLLQHIRQRNDSKKNTLM